MKLETMNLLARANLGAEVDLYHASKSTSVSYDSSRYFCAYFSDDSMKAKVSIFASGKMIAVGAKSEISARRDLNHVCKVLSHHGLVSGCNLQVTVRNVVLSVDTGTRIDLERLASNTPGAVYEPEQFPGVILRPKTCTGAVLVFSSGKMVFSGLRSEAGSEDLVREVVDEIEHAVDVRA